MKPTSKWASIEASLLSRQLDDALQAIAELKKEWENDNSANASEQTKLAGYEALFLSQQAFFIEEEPEEAFPQIDLAIEKFRNAREKDLADAARAIGTYYLELLEIKKGNYNTERFQQIKSELTAVEKYILYETSSIELKEANFFGRCGLVKIAKHEWDMAQILYNKSAQNFFNVGNSAYKDDPKRFNYLMAMGWLQKSTSYFMVNERHFDAFDFSFFSTVDQKSNPFVNCIKFCTSALEAKGDTNTNAQIISTLKLVKGLYLISESFRSQANSLHLLLTKKNIDNFPEQNIILNKIRTANMLFVELEELPLISISKSLELRANNLIHYISGHEKRSPPSGLDKDFIFSLKKLISAGDIESVFSGDNINTLMEKAADYKLINETIHISSRFQELNNTKKMGLLDLDLDKYNIAMNNIKLSFLELLDSLAVQEGTT